MQHFTDRLLQAIQNFNAPACVGFDPVLAKLPPALLDAHNLRPDTVPDLRSQPARAHAMDAVTEFGEELFRIVADHVPAVKVNIAFFEPYGPEGLHAYHRLVADARALDLLVIGDVKRADIGHTSRRYAVAHLGDPASSRPSTSPTHDFPDAITINPYFGSDGVSPFIEVAAAAGRGLFVLVQTSNPSAAEIQGLLLPDGLTVCQHVGRLVESWSTAEGLVGDSGYSLVGAVVSPRDLDSTVRVRELMPHCLFLVPGFGAQGRTADEVARCFKPDGTGAIVTASRSVIFAYADGPHQTSPAEDWRRAVESACVDFVREIRSVLS